jgi:pSer/pThr/pTyr-binding forkhead associated (FHA) protein
MKIRLIQPGQPDVHAEVTGDSLTLGRSPECDVVVVQSYVSKQHLRILRGLVAVDLNSSNGTFLEGDRLEPVVALAPGQRLRLGPDEVYLEVLEEVGLPTAAEVPVELPAEVSAEAEALQRRNDSLAFELEEAKRGGEERVAQAEAKREAEEKRNEDLGQRLESLKAELERQATDDSGSLSAKLAEDRRAEVQTRNEELEREIAALRESAVEATADEGMHGELEALRVLKREQEAKLQELQEQAQTPASDLFFQQQGEIRGLKEQIAELESGRGAEAPITPEVAPDPLPPSPPVEELQAENREIRQRNEGLSGEVSRLTGELASLRAKITEQAAIPAPPPPPVPAAVPAPVPAPVPAAVAPRPAPADEKGVRALMRAIAGADVEGRSPLFTGSAEEFLTLESFRFLRQVEKIVTRMAGGFIQLYQLRTVLPDVEGTMRGLVEGILDDPTEREPREDLVQYIEELRKWLVVSLGAHRQAAERFADELKNDLGERSLTAETPIPAYKKIAGQGDAELWKRVNAYLRELTPDTVDDRLEKLARVAAQEILRSTGGNSPEEAPGESSSEA